MNIFVLDSDIVKSSEYLVDKHLVKQILEHCQILCTVHHVYNTLNIPYRKTHVNHPCTIWVRESLSNYNWLVDYTQAMLSEYTYRYEKIHACQKVIDWARKNILPIEDKGLTPFALAMPEQYKNKSAVTSYRNYYIGEKHTLFSWKKRKKPYWIKKHFQKLELIHNIN